MAEQTPEHPYNIKALIAFIQEFEPKFIGKESELEKILGSKTMTRILGEDRLYFNQEDESDLAQELEPREETTYISPLQEQFSAAMDLLNDEDHEEGLESYFRSPDANFKLPQLFLESAGRITPVFGIALSKSCGVVDANRLDLEQKYPFLKLKLNAYDRGANFVFNVQTTGGLSDDIEYPIGDAYKGDYQ